MYDVLGPSAVIYNGTTYYYTRNAQGDITGIVNASGTQVVAYTYDAWGNPLTTTGSMANTLGALNPLRYRGYVYDSDGNLYYLQSRYYSPSWGRFINADAAIAGVGGSPLGYNQFAYCHNNPVALSDSKGTWPVIAAAGFWEIAKIAVAAVLSVVAGTAIGDAIKDAVESIERPKKHRDQSVYIMRDKNSQKVMYVGRTNDPVRRQKEHDRDPKKEHLTDLDVVFTNLTKTQARVVEQALISAYTLPVLDNARREIAPHNIFKFYSDVSQVVSLWDGMIESELLCLMEG